MLPDILNSLVQEVVDRVGEQIDDDQNGSEYPDILTFEELTQQLTENMALGLMNQFIKTRAQQAQGMIVKCPTCGEQMERHDKSSWTRQTMWGETRVEDDGYRYCRKCKMSDRPLHGYLGTDRETWSLLVQEMAVDLATDESCQTAVEKLGRHHRGIQMNRSTALRLLHHHGSNAREFIAEKFRHALQKAASESQLHQGAVELEVEYDGGMVPVATLHPIEPEGDEPVETTPVRGHPKRRKDCRWEEVKVGLAQAPGEISRLYSVRPTNELDKAFEDLLALACMKDWTEDTSVRGIADGARYIRTRMEDTFHACSFQFILDRPHAKEHLSNVSKLLAGKNVIQVSAQTWYDQAIKHFEKGNAKVVVDELNAAFEQTKNDDIRREAKYFERNQDAVNYGDYRDREWSSASSEVESAHRHIVQVRLKIPGAWWHPDNIPNILALRMLKANAWWDEYWNTQKKAWRDRAKQLAAKRTMTE